jgi:3-oxoacyl-[acyl-carrier protein] reductase
MPSFDNKVALITGASRGIGRAIAVELCRLGADVALIGRDRAALNETAGECAAVRPGATAEVLIADVAEAAAVEGAVAATLERFGRVDFAIANAGQSIDGLLMRSNPRPSINCWPSI